MPSLMCSGRILCGQVSCRMTLRSSDRRRLNCAMRWRGYKRFVVLVVVAAASHAARQTPIKERSSTLEGPSIFNEGDALLTRPTACDLAARSPDQVEGRLFYGASPSHKWESGGFWADTAPTFEDTGRCAPPPAPAGIQECRGGPVCPPACLSMFAHSVNESVNVYKDASEFFRLPHRFAL